jgi:hypothetical protein
MDNLRARHVQVLLGWFKEGPPGAIAVEPAGRLQAVTWEDAGDGALVERLAGWRGAAPAAARHWLTEDVLRAPARVLFWVRDGDGELAGHVGLSQFDFARGTAVISDLRGDEARGPLLNAAARALARWAREALGLRAVDARQRLVAAAS